MLNKDNFTTVYHRNLRALEIETYKVIQRLSSSLLNDEFMPRQYIYDLRGNKFLERRRVKSMRYGIESISFLAPKI